MNYDIIDVKWYTPMGGACIGIVTIKFKIDGDIKSYIGVGNGFDEELDINYIIKTGAKFLGGIPKNGK